MEESNVVADVRESEVPRLWREHAVASEDAVGDLVHVLHASVDAKLNQNLFQNVKILNPCRSAFTMHLKLDDNGI